MGEMRNKREILRKVFIKGKIIAETGLRIGGESFMLSIGGIDLVVMRDPVSNQPYIPGSSIKGKMRALFERVLGKELINTGSERNPTRRHECGDPNCEVCRLYGSSIKKSKDKNIEENLPSRILVRDAFLTEESVKMLSEIDTDLPYTEWKTENAIDRITSAANPRQIERIPAGSEFSFEIVYTSENKEHEVEDIKNIFRSLKLVEDDYLGWGGSRGYGKVKFKIEEIVVRDREFYTEGKDERKIEKKQELEDIVKNLEESVKEITG